MPLRRPEFYLTSCIGQGGLARGGVVTPGGGGGAFAPVVIFAIVEEDGETLRVVFSVPITGDDGFTLTGTDGPIVLTFVDFGDDNDIIFETDRPINADEILTLSYVPGDVEDLNDNPLAPFTNFPVVNDVVPTPITSFPVGIPGGQIPLVYIRDISEGFDLYTLGSTTVSVYPSSLVKLMTVLLAYEFKSAVWASETVTVTAADLSEPLPGLSSAGLQENDVITWEGLGYGILLDSGYDAAQCIARNIGSDGTGTGGMAAFVTLMNTRAAELLMTTAEFTDPIGLSKTFGPDTERNLMSCTDVMRLLEEVATKAVLLTQSQAATFGVTITGVNARTQTMTNFSSFMNGPTEDPQGVRDTTVLLSKDGTWDLPLSAVFNSSKATLWQAPSGNVLAIVTMQSKSVACAMLDQRGLMYLAPFNFAYLADTSSQTDPSIASVQWLTGSDGSIIDESAAARSLTVTSVTVGDPILQQSTGAALFNATTDRVSAADAASLEWGAGSGTAEVWYCGSGVLADGLYFSKWGPAPACCFTLEQFSSEFRFYLSSDGTAFTNVVVMEDWTADEFGCFRNGAPRHMAIVKNGSSWKAYVNGEQSVLGFTQANMINGGAAVAIGLRDDGGDSALGRYDDWRYTTGVARYTAAMVTLGSRKFPRT